jgi:lipid-binding SYLF domain-containing protein
MPRQRVEQAATVELASAYAQGRRADQAVSAGLDHVADVCTWSTDRVLFD